MPIRSVHFLKPVFMFMPTVTVYSYVLSMLVCVVQCSRDATVLNPSKQVNLARISRLLISGKEKKSEDSAGV